MYQELDPAEAAAQRHQKRDIDVMWSESVKENKPQQEGDKSTPPIDPTKKKQGKSKSTKLLAVILVALLIFFGITIVYLLFFWGGSGTDPADPSNPDQNVVNVDDPNDNDTDDRDQNDPNASKLNYIFPYELADRDIEIKMAYDEKKRIDADTIGKVYKMSYDGAVLRVYVKSAHRGFAENMIGGSQGVLIEDGIYRVKAKDVETLGSNSVWGYHLMIGETQSACSTVPTPCYDDGMMNHERYGAVEITLTYPKSFDTDLEQEILQVADDLVRSFEVEESLTAKYMGDAEDEYSDKAGYIYFEKCYELEDLCEHYLMKPDQADLISGKLDDTQRGGIYLLTGFLFPTRKVGTRTQMLTFSGDVVVDQEQRVSYDDGDSNKYFDAMFIGDASDIAYEYSGYVYFKKCDVKTSTCHAYLLDKSVAAKYNYFLGDDYLEREFLIQADLESLGAAGGTGYFMLTGDIDIKLLD